MKKYIPMKEDGQFLKVETYYSKGGYNVFTYKEETRGYYLSIVPVERQSRDGYTMESFMAFSGLKKCLVPVKRASKKAEAEAEEFAEDMLDDFVAMFCRNRGIELATA